MINKLNKKHKIILIVIGILIITSITVGISYAYWQLTHKQTKNNEVAAGCFEVTFEETGSDIVLTNTFPITDEEGLQKVPYKFKIKNTCTIDAQYNITLNSFGTTNLMADSSIKYAFGLSKKDKLTYEKKILTTASENTNTSNINLNDLIKSYIIGSGYLRVGEEKEFSLYLWMDENVGNDQMNKTFSAKIYITNVATNKAPLLANLTTTSNISATGKFLNGPIAKNTIEKIEFVNSNKVPTDAVGSWDVSAQQNGAIMAWYYDSDANSKYEVYIGQDEGVVANSDSSYLFQNLTYLASINLANLDTSNITNMSNMFYYTGYSSTVFTLDLGSDFDTSNVTTMGGMFSSTGYSSTVFTLDLGDKFDTSKVTNMGSMFASVGYRSKVFNLDLGKQFDTSNVTNMNGMFGETGYSNTVFTLDLGDKFDTSNVTTMGGMFNGAGRNSTVFTLDLGDKFNTSNVTNMSSMFRQAGLNSPVFTLDLGDKFDTSKVTDMGSMFSDTGKKNTVFTLDLGDQFNTSNVTNMGSMFAWTGWSSSVLTLKLGDKFDTSKVTNMNNMFYQIGWSNSNFILDLRTFNFDKVSYWEWIFDSSQSSHTAYVKNASDKTWVSRKIWLLDNEYTIDSSFNGTVIDCSISTCP